MVNSLVAQPVFTPNEYHIEYVLEASPNANCNIPNELILNDVGCHYQYDPNDTQIDGVKHLVMLNVPGVLNVLNALDKDITLNMILKYNQEDNPIKNDASTRCINTQYGFKSSEVIGCMENFSSIPDDDFNGQLPGAKLTIIQKAYLIDDNKIAFDFYIKNIGSQTARNILFKDLLSPSLSVEVGGIYINRCHAYPEYVSIKGRVLIIKLQDIVKGDSEVLTFICNVNGKIDEGEVNIGCLSYVSSCKFSRVTQALSKSSSNERSPQPPQARAGGLKYELTMIQTMSNPKGMNSLVKC